MAAAAEGEGARLLLRGPGVRLITRHVGGAGAAPAPEPTKVNHYDGNALRRALDDAVHLVRGWCPSLTAGSGRGQDSRAPSGGVRE